MSEETTKKEQEKIEKRDMISEANAAATRMEEATNKMNEATSRMESLMVEKTLSGKSDVAPPVKQEVSNKEYAEKVMKGEL